MSSLSEIRPGVWKVRAYVGLDPVTGRQRARSKTFQANGIRAARKMQARIETEWDDERRAHAAYVGTVAELVDRWLRLKRSEDRSPTYLTRAEFIGKRIQDMIGHVPARDLTARHVSDWHVALRELPGRRRMSQATVLHHHRILSAVLRMAREHGDIDKVATEATRPKKVDRYQIELPPSDTIQALLDAAPSHLRGAAWLAALTGLRRGELFGLQWTDVEPGVIHVRRSVVELAGGELRDKPPKSDRARKVWISPDLQDVLVGWRLRLEDAAAQIGGVLADDARVLPNLRADTSGRTPMRPGWLTLAWSRHCEKHGVKVRVHDLRHWYATHMLGAGLTAPEVAALLGHAQVSTTVNIYGHTSELSADRARAAIGGALSLPAS